MYKNNKNLKKNYKVEKWVCKMTWKQQEKKRKSEKTSFCTRSCERKTEVNVIDNNIIKLYLKFGEEKMRIEWVVNKRKREKKYFLCFLFYVFWLWSVVIIYL